MDDLERRRQTVKVLELLDESHKAHAAGDDAEFDRLAEEVCRLDVEAVSVIRGGMLIGEIPRPDRDPRAWAEYVQDARDALAGAEAGHDDFIADRREDLAADDEARSC